MMTEVATLDVVVGIAAFLTVLSLIGLRVRSKARGPSKAIASSSEPLRDGQKTQEPVLDEVETALERLRQSTPNWPSRQLRIEQGRLTSLPFAYGRDLETYLNDTFPTLQALHAWYPADYQRALDVARARVGDPTGKIDDVNNMSGAIDGVAQVVHDLVRSHLTALDTDSARDLFGMVIADVKELPWDEPDALLDRIMSATVLPTTLLDPCGMYVRSMATSAMLEQLALRPAPPAQPLERPQLMELADCALDTLLRHLPTEPDELDTEDLGPEWEEEITCELYLLMIRLTIDASPDDLRPMLAMAAAGGWTREQVSICWTEEAGEIVWRIEDLGGGAVTP